MLWCSVALLALFASAQGRAVNISNTWVLPEEGFPVFYRYFRDRISWYEADAVCQFHHANLVTVDTTAQYDAVRAYLKELDISSAVWVGLIRSNPDGDFTWTDYRGLSGDGYWSSAPDSRSAPLCAAADPAADYRWEARACGGPTVASFICELPVPQWALGNEGCMIRALPALTVLYLPESAAVQLTADCGLAGVKRVQCTGSLKREDLLRDLSCVEDDEPSSTLGLISIGTTWLVTTDVIFTDEDATKETTTVENSTTEHEDDINQPNIKTVTSSSHEVNLVTKYKSPTVLTNTNKYNKIILNKNVNFDIVHNNNLQSNYIPNIANEEKFLTSEQLNNLEDEKHMQHKMLHEEIARLGNLDNIFTQPTDHFVPPLVMAKAKIGDDMTVLSLAEKHAQQLAEKQLSKQTIQYRKGDHVYVDGDNINSKSFTRELKTDFTERPVMIATQQIQENEKIDKIKNILPKKYNEKYNDAKSKMLKGIETKLSEVHKTTEIPSTHTESISKEAETVTIKPSQQKNIPDNTEEDPSIDLTVLIKDDTEDKSPTNYSDDIAKFEVIQNITAIIHNETGITFPKIEADSLDKQEIPNNYSDEKIQNVTFNNEIIKITIVAEENTSATPTVFEITTKVPVFQNSSADDNNSNFSTTHRPLDDISTSTRISAITDISSSTPFTIGTGREKPMVIPASDISAPTASNTDNSNDNFTEHTQYTLLEKPTTTTGLPSMTTITSHNITEAYVKNYTEYAVTTSASYSTTKESLDVFNAGFHEEFDKNTTDTSETVDDFQSPLLSAANEPLHRPNRSRRPQTPPNRNKFNPFRILG